MSQETTLIMFSSTSGGTLSLVDNSEIDQHIRWEFLTNFMWTRLVAFQLGLYDEASDSFSYFYIPIYLISAWNLLVISKKILILTLWFTFTSIGSTVNSCNGLQMCDVKDAAKLLYRNGDGSPIYVTQINPQEPSLHYQVLNQHLNQRDTNNPAQPEIINDSNDGTQRIMRRK